MVVAMLISRLAGEGQVPHTEHVERGNRSTTRRCQEEYTSEGRIVGLHKGVRLFEDRIFRVETTETQPLKILIEESHDKRHTSTSNRQTAHQHCVGRDRHFLAQAAHLRHLIRVNCMDHRPRAHE